MRAFNWNFPNLAKYSDSLANPIKKILNRFVFNALFDKEWDDLIFSDRNKNYGAYELRRIFNRNQLLGLIFTIVAFTGFILFVNITYDNSKPVKFEFEEMIEFKGFDANLLSVQPLKKEQKVEAPKEEEVKTEEVKNDLPPEVKEDVPEVLKDPVLSKIDSIKKLSDSKNGDSAKKTEAGADSGAVKEVYTEGPAGPYGGLVEFQKWVQAHIVKPQAAIDAGITGTIIVTFTIDKEGNIKNVKLMKGFGYGCDEEVIRVVSMAPKWKPLVRAGFAVESRFKVDVLIH